MVGGAGGIATRGEEAGVGGSSMGFTTRAGLRVEYQQSTSPRLVPEAKDKRHGAWSTTDRQ